MKSLMSKTFEIVHKSNRSQSLSSWCFISRTFNRCSLSSPNPGARHEHAVVKVASRLEDAIYRRSSSPNHRIQDSADSPSDANYDRGTHDSSPRLACIAASRLSNRSDICSTARRINMSISIKRLYRQLTLLHDLLRHGRELIGEVVEKFIDCTVQFGVGSIIV